MMNVMEIRRLFINDYKLLLSRNETPNTIELMGESFIASEDAIFGTPDKDYIRREIAWYESKHHSINKMEPPVPKIWEDIAGVAGYVNSNYGKEIYTFEDRNNSTQYKNVVDELKADPYSRRAIMMYAGKTAYRDRNIYGCNDMLCTIYVQCMIRDDMLRYLVNMRSCDVVFGYKNDYPWHRHVAEKLIKDLGLQSYSILWHAGSLHIYKKHYKLIDEWM